MLTLFDGIGLFGVLLILAAYFLLQVGRIKSHHLIYSVLNLLGAGLILFSLIFAWNLASFVVETFWLMISIYGVVKSIGARGRRP